MIVFYTVSWSDLRTWMGQFPTMIVASSAYNEKTGKLRRTSTVTDDRKRACDSGGFLAARRWGDFPYSEADYVEWAMSHDPDWLATMDYCTEPELGRESVEWCIEHTIERAQSLMETYPNLPWLPVLQGDKVQDYLDCLEKYRTLDLLRPYMGIGSLCRRTKLAEVEEVVSALGWALPDMRFHLFGVKLSAAGSPVLHKYAASLDTAAWGWEGIQGQRYIKSGCGGYAESGLTRSEYKFQVLLKRYEQKLQKKIDSIEQPALL